MKLSYKHLLLVSLPLFCLGILATILIWNSARDYRNYRNFGKITQLLIQNSNLASAINHEKHMTWGAITLRGKNPPEVQIQNFKDSTVQTDEALEALLVLVNEMDRSAYSDRFASALGMFDDIAEAFGPIREKVLARSVNKDVGKRMYVPTEDAVNGFFGLLCTETSHPELVRKIFAQNSIIDLKIAMWNVRAYVNSGLKKDGMNAGDYQKATHALARAKSLIRVINNCSDELVRARLDELIEDPNFAPLMEAGEFVTSAGQRDVGTAEYNYPAMDAFVAAKSGVSEAFSEFIEFVNQDIQDFNEKETQRAWASLRNVIVFSVAALAACVALCLMVSKRINESIIKVGKSLHESASAGLNSADSIGVASQTLADGATSQAASLEEICASLEEVASSTKANVASVGQCTNVAQTANQSVIRISEEVGGLRTAMDEIEKSSNEVSSIIKIIEEIAFQTNILALNAAVEAARAGEAGSGFAVVAEEVRNLASRSAEAASEISVKLLDSANKSKQGNEISKEVEGSLERVLAESGELTNLLEKIDVASNQQNEGIQHINTEISRLDEFTQSSAAQAEESAGAIAEMQQQSQVILRNVGVLEAMVHAKGGQRPEMVSHFEVSPAYVNGASNRLKHAVRESEPTFTQF